jgi:hypothetical protein
MFTRAFKSRGGKLNPGPSKEIMEEILRGLEAERIVLGHAPTKQGIVTDHPRYGGTVIMVDTSISDDERGRLGALLIDRGALSTVYAEDRADGEGLLEREESLAGRPPGLLGRLGRAVVRMLGGSAA